MNTAIARLYDTDFYGWTRHQADSMRTRNLANLDFDNLIEEIESMGKSQQRALESRLEVLLMHLLKWQFQPRRRTPSWQFTIKEQRRRIGKLLQKNPSLGGTLGEVLADAYENAVFVASEETGIDESTFPPRCPWTFDQLMDARFWPEAD